MSNNIGPANPAVEGVWKKRGVEFADAARIVAENDDVRHLVYDKLAMPISVGILALMYGVSDEIAKEAVIHWVRRKGTEGTEMTQGTEAGQCRHCRTRGAVAECRCGNCGYETAPVEGSEG